MLFVTRIFFIFCFGSITKLAFSGSFIELKNMGNDYLTSTNFDNGIDSYKKALNIAPTNADKADLYALLGQCYFEINEFQSALEYFKLALKNNNKHKKALYWAIKLQMEFEKKITQNTSQLLSGAIKSYPMDKSFRILLAEFEMRKAGSIIVSDLSLIKNILNKKELDDIKEILDRSSWRYMSPKRLALNQFVDQDMKRFEQILGLILERFKANNILPAHVQKVGYSMLKYEHGGYMAQHKDDPKRIDKFVIGISIGGPCKLQFVSDKNNKTAFLPLPPNSLFCMEKNAHSDWSHGIEDVQEWRYSILFNIPTANDTSPKYDIERRKFVSGNN